MKNSTKGLIALYVLLFASISTFPMAQATPNGNIWAVIVCATVDAKDESDLLYETLTTYYNFDDEHILYLHVNGTIIAGADAKATKDNVRTMFNTTLASISTENDIVFIYIMAHGGGYNMLYYETFFDVIIPHTIRGGRAEVSWDDDGEPAYSDEGNETRESSVRYNGLDVNEDGDLDDWFGVDECMWFENYTQYWDDELASDLSSLSYRRLIFVYMGCFDPFNNSTGHCYGGGFIDDLSAPNRIILTASNETFPATRKFERVYDDQGNYDRTIIYNMSFWGEQFISALGRNQTEADINNDGKVSMKEAFEFAWENDPMTSRPWWNRPKKYKTPLEETPWMDDNGNGLPTWVEEDYKIDSGDGGLAIETYFGFEPIFIWDLNGDGEVTIFDVRIAARAYDSQRMDDPTTPWDDTIYWDSRADVKEPWGKITISDVRGVARYYGVEYSSNSASSSNSVMTFSYVEGVGTEGTTVVSVYHSAITVFKGETFFVDVTLSDVTNLGGWEFRLYWNSSLLNCTGAEVHAPSIWNGKTFEVGPGIENNLSATEGRYWKGLSAMNPAPSFNGSMTLATLTFKALAAGTTILDLQETNLADSEAYAIPHTTADGSVTILYGRYMRGDTHTINNLTAYVLNATKSNIPQNSSRSDSLTYVWGRGYVGATEAYYGIRVWVRHADGTETELTGGTPVAHVSRSQNGEGIQTATWNCSATPLTSADALVVRVYIGFYMSPEGYVKWPGTCSAEFITEQLQAQQLVGSTWTVHYYTKCEFIYTGPGLTWQINGYFYWGTTTYNSRLENLQYA